MVRPRSGIGAPHWFLSQSEGKPISIELGPKGCRYAEKFLNSRPRTSSPPLDIWAERLRGIAGDGAAKVVALGGRR